MSESDELSKLYLPSYWSKRLTPEKICLQFIEITKKISDEIKTKVPCNLDIQYGASPKQKFDLFGTSLPNDSPIFVFIHGGYWQEQSVKKDNSSFMVGPFFKNKCKIITIGYTLCPEVTLPQIIDEIQSALKKCLSYAEECGTRSVVIGGHSAGAHLTISLFPTFYESLPETQKKLIKAAFLIAGIYDLTPLVQTVVNDPLKLNENTARQISPMFGDFKSIGKNVKFCIIAADSDSPAFIKQAESFHNVLNDQGVESSLKIVEGTDHFDVMEKMVDENYEIVKLIIESMR